MKFLKYEMPEKLRTRLVKILGDTEQTQRFVEKLIDSIDITITTKGLPNLVRNNSQRFDDLKKIDKAAKKLVTALKPVSVKYGEVYSRKSEEGQGFMENVDVILASSLSHKLTDKSSNSDPNQIINLIETLNLLSVCCVEVSEFFKPMKGSRSSDEERMQLFEELCVFNYRESYDCLPAKNPNGAFLKVMIEAYKEAGFSRALGNAYQRLQKAINRYSENFCKDEAESMKPRRKLHPPIND